MAVRKPCRSKGCKTSPRCEHPWWLDVMHKHRRYRMPVDDFALARGATAPVTSKQEAEKVWEPRFIAEIVSGKDPRVPIEREMKFERPTTVADLLKLYRTRYVEVEPLKSRAGMLSQLNVLSAQLGTLPATALERPDAIEDFKKRYADRAIETTNRYLARLRHVCNWAIGRDLLTKTAFHPRGVRIPAKAERRRERRVSEAEEQRLLEACKLLNEPTGVAISRILVALSGIVSVSRIMLEHGRALEMKPLPHLAVCDHSWRRDSNNRHHLHHLAAVLVGPLLGPL